MATVLVLSTPGSGEPALAADFTAAGFTVLGEGDCAQLVRETLRAAPDVLVCWARRPTADLLRSVATLQAEQPVPVLFFTDDPDAELMGHALDAGVHAWVVQGYAPQRLRVLVQLARTREARDRKWRSQVAELSEKLDERKWVDRAKGILMHAQQVNEEQAFQLLRNASMQGNRKVGQVSRQVIEAARIATAINRAGQQRMLSQRMAKLALLQASGVAQGTDAALRETARAFEAGLVELAQAPLSTPQIRAMLEHGRRAW
ncbi:MAG TPA: ANTAR domain-containing protein, partial [Ramlibacter sp.]